MLLSLLVLPLYIPVLIFGAGAVTASAEGMPAGAHLSLLGAFLLPRIVASVFEVEPRCRRIMFDPDHRNSGARRLCEYAGCTFLGEHDMSNRRMALYALPRPINSA